MQDWWETAASARVREDSWPRKARKGHKVLSAPLLKDKVQREQPSHKPADTTPEAFRGAGAGRCPTNPSVGPTGERWLLW